MRLTLWRTSLGGIMSLNFMVLLPLVFVAEAAFTTTSFWATAILSFPFLWVFWFVIELPANGLWFGIGLAVNSYAWGHGVAWLSRRIWPIDRASSGPVVCELVDEPEASLGNHA